MKLLLEDERVLACIIVISLLILNVLGQYIFHVVTWGRHFRPSNSFEPLDTPIPKTATNRNYDANVALIQGRVQIMFPDVFAEYAKYMSGDRFVEYVAAEYYDNEKSSHRVSSLARQIMSITPNNLGLIDKLLNSVHKAIELMPKP